MFLSDEYVFATYLLPIAAKLMQQLQAHFSLLEILSKQGFGVQSYLCDGFNVNIRLWINQIC